MRRILLASVLFPACAFADQIPATSRITDVTVYAGGARVVREVAFDAPAGTHDITLDDLPPYLEDGTSLRILPGAGVTVGSYLLRAEGIPTGKPHLSGAQKAVDDRVKVLETDERRALATIDAINARIEAADAMAGFLRQIGTGEAGLGEATPQALQDMAEMVGTKTAEATNIRAAALFERRQAEADLAEVQRELEAARAALGGMTGGFDGTPTELRVSFTSTSGGPGTMQVAYFVSDAMWMPVYDIDLARKDKRMTLSRGVVVVQQTDEDWTDVNLTLSTATPEGQTGVSWLGADLRRIEPEVQPEARVASDSMMAGAPAEPAMEAAVVEAKMMGPIIEGDTVTYRYGLPVSMASGLDRLRLALDTIDLTPSLRAVAVPRHDQTAYLEATVTNTTEEILLPGEVMLLRDGVLVGSTGLDTTAPGVEFKLSFGPIEGLLVSRTLPVRAEGETGILSSSSQIEETATLKVENKTTEAWDLRVLDSVPYSEQEDLEITYTADPEPTETRVDGVRGHLAWDFTLPAGETREIKVDHMISWPEGMVLR